ncbi:MAG: CoA transferase, partial [Chloroflexi bacterium]|nr:CoA transferase [Chloroflexota bacterium]
MGPLGGIKVVELAQWIAAPAAAAILSDWGAEVIKIEEPAGGDALRGYAETRSDYPKTRINAPFELDNRNKKSIAIDLRHKLGQEIAYRLVKDADIFLT